MAETDTRSLGRRERDEQIGAEEPLAPPNLPSDASPVPVESHLVKRRRPVAVAGIVENGLVRPLDPAVRLTERAQVIIVTSEPT